MQIQEIMNSAVVSIAPEESAALAARLMSRHNLGALPVCSSDGILKGMITDRDIVLRCVATSADPANVPVRDIMTSTVEVVDPADDLSEAARRMARQQVRRLPVVSQQKVIGMLSLGDLARCRACDMEAGAALTEISKNVKPSGNA